MIRRSSAASIVVAAVVAGGCGGSAPDGAGADPSASESAADLQSIVSEFVAEGPGGIIVSFAEDGERTVAGTGVADATGVELDGATPMRVGSISKPFVATMVLQMVDEGAVAIDERLGTYLPDLPVGSEVTLDELLGHRSGIANYTSNPAFFIETFAAADEPFTDAQVLEYAAGVDQGQRGVFEYSNTNYYLLGMLIEAVDGADLDTSLQRRIAGPIDLDHTSFPDGSVAIAGMSGGWSGPVFDGDPAADYTALVTGAGAAGALVSTVDDLMSFMEGLVGGELLSDEAFEAMTDFGEDGYGYGVFAVTFAGGVAGLGHDGGIPGYTSSMGIAFDESQALVVLSNSDDLDAGLLASEIVARL